MAFGYTLSQEELDALAEQQAAEDAAAAVPPPAVAGYDPGQDTQGMQAQPDAIAATPTEEQAMNNADASADYRAANGQPYYDTGSAPPEQTAQSAYPPPPPPAQEPALVDPQANYDAPQYTAAAEPPPPPVNTTSQYGQSTAGMNYLAPSPLAERDDQIAGDQAAIKQSMVGANQVPADARWAPSPPPDTGSPLSAIGGALGGAGNTLGDLGGALGIKGVAPGLQDAARNLKDRVAGNPAPITMDDLGFHNPSSYWDEFVGKALPAAGEQIGSALSSTIKNTPSDIRGIGDLFGDIAAPETLGTLLHGGGDVSGTLGRGAANMLGTTAALAGKAGEASLDEFKDLARLGKDFWAPILGVGGGMAQSTFDPLGTGIQETIGDPLGRAGERVMGALGDVRAANPTEGLNAAQGISDLRKQIPDLGDAVAQGADYFNSQLDAASSRKKQGLSQPGATDALGSAAQTLADLGLADNSRDDTIFGQDLTGLIDSLTGGSSRAKQNAASAAMGAQEKAAMAKEQLGEALPDRPTSFPGQDRFTAAQQRGAQLKDQAGAALPDRPTTFPGGDRLTQILNQVGVTAPSLGDRQLPTRDDLTRLKNQVGGSIGDISWPPASVGGVPEGAPESLPTPDIHMLDPGNTPNYEPPIDQLWGGDHPVLQAIQGKVDQARGAIPDVNVTWPPDPNAAVGKVQSVLDTIDQGLQGAPSDNPLAVVTDLWNAGKASANAVKGAARGAGVVQATPQNGGAQPQLGGTKDLPKGAGEKPSDSGVVYITDANGNFIGVRDPTDGNRPIIFGDKYSDATKDAIVARIKEGLAAGGIPEPSDDSEATEAAPDVETVETSQPSDTSGGPEKGKKKRAASPPPPPASSSTSSGGSAEEPITPLATGSSAGGGKVAGTPLITKDGKDTGLVLTDDGKVVRSSGKSYDSNYDSGGSGGNYYKKNYSSGSGSSYRSGSSRSRRGSSSKSSSSDRFSGFPFDRQNSPMRQMILQIIADSMARSRSH